MAKRKAFNDRNVVNTELNRKTREQLEREAVRNHRSVRREAEVLIMEAIDRRGENDGE